MLKLYFDIITYGIGDISLTGQCTHQILCMVCDSTLRGRIPSVNDVCIIAKRKYSEVRKILGDKVFWPVGRRLFIEPSSLDTSSQAVDKDNAALGQPIAPENLDVQC
jgi:hypothetical protein